ncbi:MAG: hypothetical protein ACKVU0_05030 [Saprospiraceae bacterium]
MLDDLKKEFEQIRQAIADGDREAAMEMLSQHCTPGDPLHDSLILLDTRLSNLQQSVIEGVISREDENIERNGISKGLLHLVKTLEARAEHPLQSSHQVLEPPKAPPVTEHSEKEPTPKSKLDVRKWAIVAGLLFTVLTIWGIISWASKHPSAPITRDLSLQLAVTPSDIPIGPLGKARILIGKYTSEQGNVPSDGVLMLKNIPIQSENDTVKILLPDLKYKHEIVWQNRNAKNGLKYQIVLKTNTFSGKVLRPDLRPVPNVDLEIEGGLARATTDAEGNFSFVLPDWGASNVQLVMRRGGKVVVNRKVGLTAAVFKDLKIPD